jgi:hypothetical protein
MATAPLRFTKRALMQNVAIEVEVRDPVHHRALDWIGRHLVRVGFRLIGVGAIRVLNTTPTEDPEGPALEDPEGPVTEDTVDVPGPIGP